MVGGVIPPSIHKLQRRNTLYSARGSKDKAAHSSHMQGGTAMNNLSPRKNAEQTETSLSRKLQSLEDQQRDYQDNENNTAFGSTE